MKDENLNIKSLSIMRRAQYEELSKVFLTGKILDLGGSKKSGYHELIKGDHKIDVVNYGDLHPGADLVFNCEEKFPLEDKIYDHVLAINFLEHIFDYHNVFSEVSRIMKNGGKFVSATPFMHHVHGSPNDYHRYTESTFKKLAEKYGFEIIYLNTLGFGLFSLIFQSITIKKIIPWPFLFDVIKFIFVGLDRILLNIGLYNKFAKLIPLGYFIIMEKIIK